MKTASKHTSEWQKNRRIRKRKRRCLAYLCWELMSFAENPMLDVYDYRKYRVGSRFSKQESAVYEQE